MFGGRNRTAAATAFLVAAALVSAGAAHGRYLVPTSGSLTMTSEAGDWVGQGNSYAYSLPTDGFFAWSDETVARVFVAPASGGNSWWVELSAPRGEKLVPGTYTGATRSAFRAAGVPGLDVSGQGRGCNTLTGSFTVHDVAYGAYGYLERLHASFEQNCEGGVPALRGELSVVDPPAPPALEVHVAVEPGGSVAWPGGKAVVQGTLACSQTVRDAWVAVHVSEDLPRGSAVGDALPMVSECGPSPTPWTATVTSYTDSFFGLGSADVAARTSLIDWFYTDYTGSRVVFAEDARTASVELAAR